VLKRRTSVRKGNSRRSGGIKHEPNQIPVSKGIIYEENET
jgi:hypothetical protein